jgi:Tfp pilus assembly protein PilE
MNTQSGRSMVEMLGVLAIIGVLSVGAIAGYSKAMMKYKLNKQAEQVGSILDYVNIHLDDFKRSKTTISTNMIPTLTKLDVIPKEMVRMNTTSKIYDIFGTAIALSNYTIGDGNYIFEFRLFINKGQKESCMNLFTIAKAKREQLWRTKFETAKGEEETSSANIANGDNYCTSDRKCLKDLSLAEMENYCTVCEDKDTCIFYYQMLF